MNRKVDKYFIERNISKLNKIGYTGFMDGKEINTIKHILNKEHLNYMVYEPFTDSDYKILYYDKEPEITCFKIITDGTLKHGDIMGALYNFNIDDDLIGDIIIRGNDYYFLVMSSMKQYFIDNFNLVGRYKIKLIETDIPIHVRMYEDMECIVSSNRIDTVMSSIINLNRSDIGDLITRKEVIINYDTLTNKSYTLKENDTFSIHRYGKYKYMGVLKNTKKGNIVVGIKKYK